MPALPLLFLFSFGRWGAPMRVGPLSTLLIALIVAPAAAGPLQISSSIDGRTVAPELLTGTSKSNAMPELDKALESFRQRDYAKALDALGEARQKNAALPPARLMLARAFLAAGQVPRGRAILEQAAADNPDYPGVYAAFGDLALTEERGTDAQLQFEKAAACTRAGSLPESQKRYFLVESHAGLAAVAESRKDWPAARASLSAWLAQEPEHAPARQRLGAVLFELGLTDAALAEFRKAVEADKTLPPAGVPMGWLWTRKGDAKKAATLMETAVQEAPDNARVHVEYANWLLTQDDVAAAKSHVESAAKLDPSLKMLKALRGLIAWQRKDYAEAEQFFQSYTQDAPDDFAVSNQLVLSLVEQATEAKRRRALQLAEMNARLYPNSGDALATLAWVYRDLNRPEDSERALRAARSTGTGTSDTIYYIARLIAASGRTEDVKPMLQAALAAPGRFSFRKEAREWLDQLSRKP